MGVNQRRRSSEVALEESESLMIYPFFMTHNQMIDRLKQAYSDAHIEVQDLTGTSDHWNVVIESGIFEGMNRVQQHQHVMSQFAKELKTGEVHALTITTRIKK